MPRSFCAPTAQRLYTHRPARKGVTHGFARVDALSVADVHGGKGRCGVGCVVGPVRKGLERGVENQQVLSRGKGEREQGACGVVRGRDMDTRRKKERRKTTVEVRHKAP